MNTKELNDKLQALYTEYQLKIDSCSQEEYKKQIHSIIDDYNDKKKELLEEFNEYYDEDNINIYK